VKKLDIKIWTTVFQRDHHAGVYEQWERRRRPLLYEQYHFVSIHHHWVDDPDRVELLGSSVETLGSL